MRKIIYLFILGLVIASCTKEPLPELPEGNDPFYTLRGNVGGDEIDLAVGENNVTISQGQEIMNGIETFYGELRAPSSNLVFRVEIIEPEFYTDNTEILSENVEFLHHEEGCLSVDFGSTGGSQMNFLLVENEEGVLVPASFVPFSEFGTYDINFQFADFGVKTFSIPVSYGFDRSSVDAEFSTAGVSDSIILAPSSIEGTHKWYINDVLVSENSSYIGTINNGIHKVKHEVDVDGKVKSYTTLVRFRASEFYWQMNLNYCDDSTPKQNFGKVKLSVEKDGVWYYSDSEYALSDEYFSVSNIEYNIDEDFKPERAIFNIALKSKLYTEDLQSELDLTDLSGRFKIGLK
ncbi:MAG: hypothetical protein MK078_10175 [Crocinitomicaceae bacterium]|nr:hypothetical protein [Crocinitomicaceae bacterium]